MLSEDLYPEIKDKLIKELKELYECKWGCSGAGCIREASVEIFKIYGEGKEFIVGGGKVVPDGRDRMPSLYIQE